MCKPIGLGRRPPCRIECGTGDVWLRVCAGRVAVDHRRFSPVLICIGWRMSSSQRLAYAVVHLRTRV